MLYVNAVCKREFSRTSATPRRMLKSPIQCWRPNSDKIPTACPLFSRPSFFWLSSSRMASLVADNVEAWPDVPSRSLASALAKHCLEDGNGPSLHPCGRVSLRPMLALPPLRNWQNNKARPPSPLCIHFIRGEHKMAHFKHVHTVEIYRSIDDPQVLQSMLSNTLQAM